MPRQRVLTTSNYFRPSQGTKCPSTRPPAPNFALSRRGRIQNEALTACYLPTGMSGFETYKYQAVLAMVVQGPIMMMIVMMMMMMMMMRQRVQ